MSLTSSKVVPSRGAFTINPQVSGGLTLRVDGGYFVSGGQDPLFRTIPTADVALVDNATNYIEVSSTGAISSNTTSFTNGAVFLYAVVVASGIITSIQDWRGGANVDSVVGRTLLVETAPKAGATAGWVVGAADDLGKLATLPASKTASTLVLRVSGLRIGETITGFTILGSIQSAGNAATLTAALRKLTGAAAGATDALIAALASPVSVTANAIVNAANASVAGLTEVVAAGVSYYVLITSTTGVSCTQEVQGALISLSPP